jgi:hypothetical protein
MSLDTARYWVLLEDAARIVVSQWVRSQPLAWFARIKANHYSKATPLGPWTLAEVGQISNFERTKCGIKF